MTELNIGSVIKDLRIRKNLKLEELSQGICTSEELFEFERGFRYPSLEQLVIFAEKLDVEVSYFFKVSEEKIFNYIENIQYLIRRYVRKRDYKSIWDIVINELEKKPISDKFTQFLKWHEGICIYYLENDPKNAINKLYEALNITLKDEIVLYEREVEILNSIAIIYFETRDFHKALDVYQKAFYCLDQLPYQNDVTIQIRVIHGLAQTMTELGMFEEALELTHRAIGICVSMDSMYLFGELYFLAGENSIRLGDKEKGMELVEKSKLIFQLQENDKFVELVDKELSRILQTS